jgi:hypothetical protein
MGPGRTVRRDEAGQALAIVLGVVLALSLGTAVMVQNTFQQFPIVTRDVVQHEAYRAMVAGLDEYLYQANANPNFIACNAKFYNGTTYIGASALTSASPGCAGLAFGSWIPMPGDASTNGPPSWFLLGNPAVNTQNGNLTINVVGAAGYPTGWNYQTAIVTLQPLNSFLLNVIWTNFNQLDPPIVASVYNVSTPTCTYYWPSNTLGSNCVNVTYANTDSLTGNVFANDTIWVCGSPSFQTVQTADTQQNYIQGCSGSPTSTSWSKSVAVQPIPTDNSALKTTAALTGCLYEGPTTLVLNGTTMSVTSPDTPTGKPAGAPGTSVSNDSLNDPANTANVCMPTPTKLSIGLTLNTTYTSLSVPALTTAVKAGDTIVIGSGATTQKVTASAAASVGATSIPVSSFKANATFAVNAAVVDTMVTIPTNGVVFTENCPNSAACTTVNYNPMSGQGETGVGGPTVGDVIVQGSVTTPTTIGAADNIIIDGDICNTDTVTSGSPPDCTTLPKETPAAPSINVLGLVALNYVEVNHPVDGGGNNVSTCPAGLGNGAPNCDLSNPVIDAAILALNHSFLVNDYNQGTPLGSLTVYGAIDQDWRGPVGTLSGGTIQTGYSKNYQYDARFKYLSPPYYLNPGTSEWGFAAFTVAAGACKLPTGQTCPAGYP